MTQKERVLKYLQTNGKITSYECFINLHIVDLQRAIYLLKKDGYEIQDRWIKKISKEGYRQKFKEYRLVVQ